jgi:hypothetical protein
LPIGSLLFLQGRKKSLLIERRLCMYAQGYS